MKINDPNDATALGIGMVHQHFKLIDVFTVLDNIILGAETTKLGFLQKKEARRAVTALSEKYGLHVDLDAKIEDITVGMQQRVEILKMLYRDNEILIFDEPTAVLTPQEIDELMKIMKGFAADGKSILFITHKLNEIMAVADRVTVLRKGKCIGTVNTADVTKEELSTMMVGRPVQLEVVKDECHPGAPILEVRDLTVPSHLHKKPAVKNVSFDVRAGEIVCIAGIDGNGQAELIEGITGLDRITGGDITLCGKEITHQSVRRRADAGMAHIPADRHKHGLVLGNTLEENIVLQRFREKDFQNHGFIRFDAVRKYANELIERFDVRSGQGAVTTVRSMSGGNQQKAIVARELDRKKPLLIAVQPTRIAVDARHVQIPLPLWVCLLERGGHVGGQRLHRAVERVKKNLLVLQKPRALVVKAQLPEKVDRCVGKASEHMFAPYRALKVSSSYSERCALARDAHSANCRIMVAFLSNLLYTVLCVP